MSERPASQPSTRLATLAHAYAAPIGVRRAEPMPPDFGGDRGRWMGVARRNLLPILACAVATVATTLLVTSRLDRVYEAHASVRIDPLKASLPSLEPLLGAPSDISTEMEVLHTQALADVVVDSLGLQVMLDAPKSVPRTAMLSNLSIAPSVVAASYRLIRQPDGGYKIRDPVGDRDYGVVEPGATVDVGDATFDLTPMARAVPTIDFHIVTRDEATSALLEHLSVDRPVREANVVTVRYRSTDPGLARDVPNALVATLIARRQTAQQSEARSTQRFLQEQLDHLSGQLTASEDRLRRFRERERIVDLPEEGRSEVGRAVQVQAQRADIELERDALARLLREVSASAGKEAPGQPSPYRKLVAFPSLLRNQAASQLLGSLAAVEDRRAELLTRRSVEDPDVQLLTDRTHALEDQLHTLAATYLQAITNQAATLDSTLAQSRSTLERFPARELQFAQLQRQSKTLEDLYTLLQTRLKEAEIGTAAEDGSVRLIDAARLPRLPISPKPVLSAVLAGIAGILIGLAFAFTRATMDRTVHSRREVRNATGVNVLGIIPSVHGERSWPTALRRVVRATLPASGKRSRGSSKDLDSPRHRVHDSVLSTTSTAALEGFNRLMTNLLVMRPNHVPTTIVLTSPLPSDGKTTVATNLALVAARQGRNVLLLDADLRRGVVNSVFRCPRSPGLSEVLEGTTSFADSIQSIGVGEHSSLDYLTCGAPSSNPVQLIGSARMQALLELVQSRYDLIILDTPPVNAVADPVTLAILSDAVLLVARAGVTSSDSLAIAMAHLRQAGAEVTGVVLNDIDFERDASYDSEYREFSRYAAYYVDVNGAEVNGGPVQ